MITYYNFLLLTITSYYLLLLGMIDHYPLLPTVTDRSSPFGIVFLLLCAPGLVFLLFSCGRPVWPGCRPRFSHGSSPFGWGGVGWVCFGVGRSKVKLCKAMQWSAFSSWHFGALFCQNWRSFKSHSRAFWLCHSRSFAAIWVICQSWKLAAMAELVLHSATWLLLVPVSHATNYSGTIGICNDTLHAVWKKFSFFFEYMTISVGNSYLLCIVH